jgi:hypothetical protein
MVRLHETRTRDKRVQVLARSAAPKINPRRTTRVIKPSQAESKRIPPETIRLFL